MKTVNPIISACRYCRHYQPEGRRGGICQQLGVPVAANWKACAFATSPFADDWKSLQEIALLEHSLSLTGLEACPPEEKSSSEKILANP